MTGTQALEKKRKFGSGFFEVLQRVGRAFMLPIALLPIAGLLLGVGASFTNEATLEAYNLLGVMGPGTVPYTVFSLLASVGTVIFDNLPLLFAMGVALGMAENEKATATLSAAIAFFVMHKTINTLLSISGKLAEGAMPEGTVANVVGIESLQMGVFGGIIVGLGVAWLHNRFYKIKLPTVISFFGGTRFVPIISTLAYILVGVAMFFLWPFVQTGIYALGDLVLRSGYAGTLIYGFIERILIPFGLHHVFYLPFWQTGVGGSAMIDGVMIYGAQNIFFAELASPETVRFSVEATRFMSGKFPELTEPDESYHGVVYTRDYAFAPYIVKARMQLMRDFGCYPAANSSFLLNLGLESLHVRMERHCANALKVAKFLEQNENVTWVNYPKLPGNSQFALAEKYLPLGACGVISFGVKGGREAAVKFMDSLRLAAIVVHVADARTSVLHPASTTHRQLTDEQLIDAGITPDLVRFSVGIENADDIIAAEFFAELIHRGTSIFQTQLHHLSPFSIRSSESVFFNFKRATFVSAVVSPRSDAIS